MKFTDLDLDADVLKAVAETGYEEPTPIQAQAIPHALSGRDVLGIAQTGTGKTASFTLPMITMLAKGRARARMPRSLILCPTRELAAQVAENFETYGKHHKLTMALLIGGVSFKDQDQKIDRGVDVLIATPGRLLDHFERGKLMLNGVQVMVVDEADRMLDMGFIPDIERIFKLTPFTRQTLFFSATMPDEITRITQEFLHNPVRVEVARASSTVDTIEQRLCIVEGGRKEAAIKTKRAALRDLIAAEGEKLTNAIIFCNRKRDVGVLMRSLEKHGLSCGALHGDLDQRVRMQVLDGFRNNQITLLVASDVAARGLDIPAVSHVFNFDAPIHAEDYVHRIGRTGRAGRSGVAITLATREDSKYLDKIEELIGRPLPRVELPGAGPSDKTEAEAETETVSAPQKRRPRRNTRREEPKAEAAPVAEPVAEEPARAPRAEKPSRAPRRREDNRRDDNRRDNRRRDDAPVVGMGDHIPAFMLIPIPVSARRKSKTAGEEAEQEADAA